MVAAIEQSHLHINHREPCQDAQFERSLYSLIDGLDVFLRNRTALDLVDELVALARLIRLNTQPAMAVVARATGLTDVLAFSFGGLANRLAEGNLGLTYIGLDFVLALHA